MRCQITFTSPHLVDPSRREAVEAQHAVACRGGSVEVAQGRGCAEGQGATLRLPGCLVGGRGRAGEQPWEAWEGGVKAGGGGRLRKPGLGLAWRRSSSLSTS